MDGSAAIGLGSRMEKRGTLEEAASHRGRRRVSCGVESPHTSRDVNHDTKSSTTCGRAVRTIARIEIPDSIEEFMNQRDDEDGPEAVTLLPRARVLPWLFG